MSPTNIVLLLEGKDYEQETLAKASRLAQGLGANLTLLHLTHSSKTRRNSLSLSQEERCSGSCRSAVLPRRLPPLLHRLPRLLPLPISSPTTPMSTPPRLYAVWRASSVSTWPR
ncbi:hypothetical protein ACSZOH_11835 [Aeromonas caviae]